MDGILGGRMTAAAAVVVATALLFGGVRAAGSDEAASRGQDARSQLPVPETVVLDTHENSLLDGRPDDGLNRFIVALETAPSDQVSPGIDAGPVDTPADLADGGLAVPFTPELRDGQLYTDEDHLSAADRELLQQLQGLNSSQPIDAVPSDAAAASEQQGTTSDLDGIAGIHAVSDAGDGFAAVTTSLGADEVAVLPGVTGVESDDQRHLTANYYSYQWPLRNTDVPGADIRWEDARTRASGSGVVVAVIDSGVSLTHPDLNGQWWTNPGETCGNGIDDDRNGYVDDCTGWDFANNDNTVDDGNADNRHGTHVSGTIAADDDNDLLVGVAPGARIMPLKIFHNGASSSSRLAAAIHYAVDNGADVINLSLGGDNGTSAEESALRRADAAGIVVAIAAGNEGRDTDRAPSYPAAYDMPVIVAVGSSDTNDMRSSFSNYGAVSVDLFAPGSDILSTVPGGLAFMSGTSMATPHVAGAAALVVQSGQRGAAVRHTLMDSAKPLAAFEGFSISGARVDAAAALGIPRGGDGVPEVTFASFNDLTHQGPDEAIIRVTGDVDAMGPGDVRLRGTLGTVYRDQGVYGILDLPVLLGEETVTTDAQAQFPLTGEDVLTAAQRSAMQTGLDLPVGLSLPAGDYALAVEMLDEAGAPLDPVVPAAIVFFTVAPAAAQTVEPGPGGAPTPDEGTAPDGPRLDVPEQDAPDSESPDPGTGGGGAAPGTGIAPGITVVPPGGTSADPSEPTGPPASGGTDPAEPTVPGPGLPGSDGPDETIPSDGATQPSDPVTGGTPPGSGGGTSTPAVPAPDQGGAPPSQGSGGVVLPTPTEEGPVDGGPSAGEPTTGEPTVEDPSADNATVQGTVSPDRGGPNQGLVSVSVPSGIPQDAFVRFGGSNAPVIARFSPTRVLVEPPPHTPGLVDVDIVSVAGTRTIRDAYTYLNAEGQVPEPTSPDAQPVDSTPPGGTSPPAGSTPPDGSPADGTGQPEPSDPGSGSAPAQPEAGTPEEEAPAPPSGPFTHNGLRLDALPDDSPLAGIPSGQPRQQACQTDVCAARSR